MLQQNMQARQVAGSANKALPCRPAACPAMPLVTLHPIAKTRALAADHPQSPLSELCPHEPTAVRRKQPLAVPAGNINTQLTVPNSLQQPTSMPHLPAAVAAAAMTLLMAEHPAGAEEVEEGAQQGPGSKAGGEAQPDKRRRLKPRELGRLLHMSDEAAMLLIERVPELVRHPVNRLQAALQRLAQTLKVDDKTACGLAIKQPRVLLIPPDQVTPRLSGLAQLLKVKDDEARGLSQQQPGLLTHHPETLRARLAALATLIKEANTQQEGGLPGGAAGKTAGAGGGGGAAPAIAQPAATAANMCRREPGLLTLTHTQLVARLTALSTALGSPASLVPALQLTAQAPTAALLPPSRCASLVAALASVLSLPTRAAGDVLVRLPNLLTIKPEALQGNLRGLSSTLGVEREAAAIMCSEQPALLLLKPADVPTRLKALEEALGVPRGHVIQLVTNKPGLLLKDPAAMAAALKAARKRGDL